MITRHHVLLGLLCAILPGSVIAESDPLLALVVTAGICTGIILPDIHMSRPKRNIPLTFAWGIVQGARMLCVPVMTTVYQVLPGTPCGPHDKRLTHSLPGVMWYGALLAGLACLAIVLAGDLIPALPVAGFLGSLLFGMLLHLAQDMCTRKGITPFFPFSAIKIAGSIRPCDIFDPRIPRFHACHGLVLALFLVLLYTVHGPLPYLLLCSGFAIGICIAYMLGVSEIGIDRDTAKGSGSPSGVPLRKV